MFYLLSKTLNYLLTPVGWLFITLLWAVLTKNHAHRKRLSLFSLSLLWLLGNGFLTNEVMNAWEVGPKPVPAKSNGQVAVVLTGGMINGLRQIQPVRPVLGHEADRIGQALYLYKTGVVQKILISGGQGNLSFQTPAFVDEGQMVARFLIIAGVPSADIVLEQKSRNTHENAIYSKQLLRQRFNTDRCVLVTSAWHMRRAEACFKKEGLIVAPFPTGFLGERRSWSPGNYLFPSEKALNDAFWIFREVVGYVVYMAVGYV